MKRLIINNCQRPDHLKKNGHRKADGKVMGKRCKQLLIEG
jgi:hypothetical protein